MSVQVSFNIGTGKYALLDIASSGYNLVNTNNQIPDSGSFSKAVFLEGLTKYSNAFYARSRQQYVSQFLQTDPNTFNQITGLLAASQAAQNS